MSVLASRRQWLLAMGSSALLGGCAEDSPYSLFLDSLRAPRTRVDPDAYPVTASEVAQLPYATLGVRIGSAPRFVMVLTRRDGMRLEWVSPDRLLFVTHGARLMQTVGLSRDLATLESVSADALFEREGLWDSAPADARRLADLRHPDAYSVPVLSHWQTEARETISILGRERPMYRVREVQQVPLWNWHCENLYWIGQRDGRVWRSVQQFCPEVAPIELELLKPAY